VSLFISWIGRNVESEIGNALSSLSTVVHERKPLPSGKTASPDDVDEFEALPLSGASGVSRMTLPRLATSGKNA
jgi:hypothetical protein